MEPVVKSRQDLVQEMINNIKANPQSNLHLTEVAKPGVIEHVHSDEDEEK